MLKKFRDKIAFSGISVLIIGLVLLMFTFISAYGVLTAGFSIISSQDLSQAFGEALAPLIAAGINAMYMGIMVWIGSIVTIRGVTIIVHTPPQVEEIAPKPMAAKLKLQHQKQQQKPKGEKQKEVKSESEETKVVNKSPEPEIAVIPPEEVAQLQPPRNSSEQSSP